MPSVMLPAFGGLSFFAAVAQQQRQARGSLLPVPQHAEAVDSHVGQKYGTETADQTDDQQSDGSGSWLSGTVQLSFDLGLEHRSLASVAAEARRSKAEQAIIKRCWAALGQQVQPAIKPEAPAGPPNNRPADRAADSGSAVMPGQPPQLAVVTASFVSSFSRCSSISSSSTSSSTVLEVGCSCASHTGAADGSTSHMTAVAAALLLDQPVIPAADTAWGKDAYMQGRTVLFCEPQELQQLWVCIPDDIPAECLEAVNTKVCRVPCPTGNTSSAAQGDAASAAAGSTPTTAAASAIGPSVQQLLRKWVVQQQQDVLSSQPQPLQAAATGPQGMQASPQPPTTAADTDPADAISATPCARDSNTAAAAAGAEHADAPSAAQDAATAAGSKATDGSTCADRLPESPGASSKYPAAAAPEAAQPLGGLPRVLLLQRTTLDEPVLQTSILAERTAQIAGPCPISSLACISSIAAAEQAGYVNSILAAGPQDNGFAAAAPSSGTAAADTNMARAPDIRRFLLPAAGPAAAASTAEQQEATADLLVPAAAVPVLMPLPGTKPINSKPADGQGVVSAADTSNPANMQQSEHPSAAQMMRSLLAGLPLPQVSSRASAADTCVRRRQSIAVRQAGKHTPRINMHRTPKSAAVTTAEPARTAMKDPPAAAEAAAHPAGVSGRSKPSTEHQDRHADADMLPAAVPSDIQCPAELRQLQQGSDASQQEAEPTPSVSQTQEDSLSGQLSPGSLFVDVPVYLHDQPSESLSAQLLCAALSTAQAVLEMSPDRWLGGAGAELLAERLGATTAGQCSTATVSVWDATWGDLGLQDAGLSNSTGLSTAAATVAGWCTPAVLAMLSGAALEAPHDSATTAAGEAAAAVQGAAAGQPGRQLGAGMQPSELPLLGSYLLEQMVTADMQLGQDSTNMLPVVLFPDADDCSLADAVGSSSGCRPHAGVCAELLAQCGIKRQSTAHLELYFDWSLLQPAQQLLSSRHSKRGSSSLPSTAAAKRFKLPCGGVAAVQRRQQQPEQQDTSAWLELVLQDNSLRQLQQDLSKKTAVPAAVPGADASSALWDAGKLAMWHSRQAVAAYVQLGSMQLAASKLPQTSNACQLVPPVPVAVDQVSDQPMSSGQVLPAVTEDVPSAVAATAAAWHLAHRQATAAQPKPGTAATTPCLTAASAVVVNAAPPSDLDFFMQLQGAGQQRNKRRHSLKVSAQGVQESEAALAEQRQGSAVQAALSAAQQVSRSPVGPSAKRPRVSAAQQQKQKPAKPEDESQQAAAQYKANQERELARCQQQQAAALATGDLALTGVNRGGAADLGAQEDAAAAAGPTVVSSKVSSTILELLLQLDGMRRTVLSAMDCPGPALVESLLWQDAAAQQLLLQHKAQQQKQQQQSGQGPSMQQKQRNKQLVVVVLLSQTAACLLHYGIRVAHMFLQHGLQRLPSVCDACKPALAALSEASDAVEQQPRAAPGSGTHSSTGSIAAAEHPKLAQLQDLVLHLKARQPDCKLLVVSEAKAFFNLYHTLSAAGILAVQLDRNKKLPMGSTYTAGGSSSTGLSADPATVATWQSAVSSALGAASCVLATHEQLHNPCMVLQDFHVLVEYVAWEATAAGQAAVAGAEGLRVAVGSSNAAVSVQFGTSRHFILAVQEPDLVAAAEEAKRAQRATAATPTARAAAAPATHTGSVGSLAGAGLVQPESAAATHAQGNMPPPAAPTTLPHAAAAAMGTHKGPAAAQHAGSDPAADAEATPEVPLVLNASAGSVVRRRQGLYQSLMQLEGQGFVLVERSLCSNSSSRGNAGAAALVGSAVDIVLTPQACLCVWDDRKLPQDPGAAFQALSRSLLALSMSYSCAYFLLEMGGELLQHILHNSSNLQGLAWAAGMKLQLLVCFAAANTQDAVLHICKEATSYFWSASATPGALHNSTNTTTTNSSSKGLQPPQGMVDVPAPAELELSACCALNPLSAAVLASHGASLRSLFEAAMSEGGLQHELLTACLPAKSLQLLQVQASAVAERIQQQRTQEQQELLAAAAAEDDQLLQQQQYQRQQYQGQQQTAEGLEQTGGFHSSKRAPAAHAVPGSDAWGAAPSSRPQQQQQQQWMHVQQKQQQPEVAHGDQGQMWATAGPTDDWHDGPEQFVGQCAHHLQQQQQWMESPSNQQHPGAQQMAGDWQQQQSGRAAELLPDLGLDPSAVLDDFLSGRGHGAPPGSVPRPLRGPSVQPAAGMRQPRGYRTQQQQQQHVSRAPARHAGMRMSREQWDPQGGFDADLQGLQFGAGPDWLNGEPTGPMPKPRGSASRAGRGVMPSSVPWAAAVLDDGPHAVGVDAAADVFAVPDPRFDQAEFMDPRHDSSLGFDGVGLDPPGLHQGGGWQGQYHQEPAGWDGELQGFSDHDGNQAAFRGRRGGSRRMPVMASDPDFTGDMFGDVGQGLEPMYQQGGSHRVNRQQQQQHQQQQQRQQNRSVHGQRGTRPGHDPHTGLGGLGGMFAATPHGTRVAQPQDLQEDDAFFDSGPAHPQHSAARPPAAAAGYKQGRRADASASDARGWASRGMQMQPVHRGFTGGPAASNSSGLSVPAFMPHHNPSKQLKYRPPVGAGVAKCTKRGKGGCKASCAGVELFVAKGAA